MVGGWGFSFESSVDFSFCGFAILTSSQILLWKMTFLPVRVSEKLLVFLEYLCLFWWVAQIDAIYFVMNNLKIKYLYLILYVNLQGIKFFLAFFHNNLTDTQLIYHTIHCELNCSEHFISMESDDNEAPSGYFLSLMFSRFPHIKPIVLVFLLLPNTTLKWVSNTLFFY